MYAIALGVQNIIASSPHLNH